MLTPLELSVLATIAYTNQFDYPLSLGEIRQRLVSSTALKSIGIANQPLTAKKVTLAAVRSATHSLQRKKLVSHRGQWYGLLSNLNSDRDQFKIRRGRARAAKLRQADWQELKLVLRRVPWIWAVAITGSTAMANAPTGADLDVLVITAPHRLWLTRLITIGLSAWRKHRNQAGWCFNLWLEPATLGLAPARQGVYEAYELWQCRWLFDRRHWRRTWIQRNAWFQQFLPQASTEPELVSRLKARRISTNSKVVLVAHLSDWIWHWLERTQNWWGDHANYLAYQIQVQYRHWRYKEVVPPLDQAFLHQPTARRQIYHCWQASLASVRSKLL